MRWQGRRESDNVEDRRGQSGSPFGGGGGGGFRLPSGKGGIVLLIIVLVAGYYGVDLTGMLTGEPMPQQQTPRSAPSVRKTMKRRSLLPSFWLPPKIPGGRS
ncbi:YpfJ protein, zinc metalloprotease superfamily [Klebsiella pneumoniae]|uniref:YpfJ protein, zinc metalloprotease superfamily n=1 Tax=Klebsiella pneumoniae TaxID=573 RepID=A0A377TX31_KLEPN|nr:YpfJ protein, zinc metalloprotease superfamily [Klebsiella pneumoniae]